MSIKHPSGDVSGQLQASGTKMNAELYLLEIFATLSPLTRSVTYTQLKINKCVKSKIFLILSNMH